MITKRHHFLDLLGLWPRWHAIEEHLFERPHVLRQSRRYRWRTGPPLLRGARAVGEFRLWEGLVYAGMRQAEIVVDMVQHELLSHAVLPLAEGGHPSPHCGDMLADTQVDALDEGRVDLSAAGRQHLLDRLQRAEHDAPTDPHQTSAPWQGEVELCRADELDLPLLSLDTAGHQ